MREAIKSLIDEEASVRGKAHFKELEGKWENLWKEEKDTSREVLIEYNRFRLRNLYRSKIKRPAALLGFINDSHFPNFQSYGLLKVADVVSIFTKSEYDQGAEKFESSIDRVKFDLIKDDLRSIIKKLPKGFKPDFFWDAQAAHGHVHPRGLKEASFPSFAGICHVHYGAAVKTAGELFDFVLPVGECFSEGFSYQSSQILNLPFGLNWASFDIDSKKLDETRDIDVSLTFSKTEDPAYGNLRNEVIELVEKIKQQNPALQFSINSGLEKKKYFEILKRSKISLNVVGVNGPYNYRTCEIINSGALLFQINHCANGIKLNPEETFIDQEEFILFTLDNLESKIVHYLTNNCERERIVQAGIKKLETECTYEKGFLSIIKKSRTFKRLEENITPDWKPAFLNGVFMWQQVNKNDTRILGAAIIGTQLFNFDDLKFYSNLLAIFPELLKSMGEDFIRNLIAQKNQSLASKLNFNNPMQAVVDIYSLSMDNAAMCYNFISLALEFGWANIQQLNQIAKQAFNGFLFPDYNRYWLLRTCIKMSGIESKTFNKVRYENFDIKILTASSLETEWVSYRDYLLTLCELGSVQQNHG